MAQDYEYYGTYDENATARINLTAQVQEWLWTTELMLEFIRINIPEILDSFVEKVQKKYSSELEDTSFALGDVSFDTIKDNQSILETYTSIKDLSLRFIMKYIPLDKERNLSGEIVEVKSIDYLRAKHMLIYHQIIVLVEILGREEGIQVFKDFVEFWGEEVAKKGRWKVTLKQARQTSIPYWENSKGFEFGVVDFDDEMFLTKFDRCVWYESMSHIEDKELAYYAVCYSGPRIGAHAHENMLMRRSVTLFAGNFCDELRWNRHVYDEPEQPSLEFSRKIVRK